MDRLVFSNGPIIFEDVDYNECYDRQNSHYGKEPGYFTHHNPSKHGSQSIHAPFDPDVDVLIGCIDPIQILNLLLKLSFNIGWNLNSFLKFRFHALESRISILSSVNKECT